MLRQNERSLIIKNDRKLFEVKILEKISEQYLSPPAKDYNNFELQNFCRLNNIDNILLILDPTRKFGKILSAQGKNRSWDICRHPPSFFSFQPHLSRTGNGAFWLYSAKNRFDKLEPFLVGRLNFWRCRTRKIWFISNSRKVLKLMESWKIVIFI